MKPLPRCAVMHLRASMSFEFGHGFRLTENALQIWIEPDSTVQQGVNLNVLGYRTASNGSVLSASPCSWCMTSTPCSSLSVAL